MIIRNRKQLDTSQLRRQALDIIESGISKVLPSAVMQSALSYDQGSRSLTIKGDTYTYPGRLFVIGAGKASGLMSLTLERIMGPGAIKDGLIIEKAEPEDFDTSVIQIRQASHPLPDQRGLDAMHEMLSLKQKYSIGNDDLVLCLISGGGSALMPCPLEGISLNDKQCVTGLLIACGANIAEINSVRKHLSCTKGGRLAHYFAPARVISLILSDVVGNDLSVIASGPTYPDQSTFEEAYSVLQTYHLLDKAPSKVISILQKGCRSEISETPKSLDNACNYIIGDVRLALEAMAAKARQLGFNPLILSSQQIGETTSAAFQRADEITHGAYPGYNALFLGGETTPVLPVNHGRGGRNQHYAACTLSRFKGYPGDWVSASVGTDGSDFMPDIAGAIVDSQSQEFFKGQELEFQKGLEGYDSHRILKMTGDSLILTGNTHTNVGDIVLYLFKMDGNQALSDSLSG